MPKQVQQHNSALDPQRKEFFDTRAHKWDEIVSHDSVKIDYILDHLEIKPGDTILDVGTGTGILIPFLNTKLKGKGRIEAVDYSKDMIKMARKKYPKTQFPIVNFHIQDIYDTPMEKGYDFIICYSCFPHFPRHFEIIQHFVQGLKKTGHLIIAHSDSRDKINNIHGEAGQEVEDDRLPSMKVMKDYFVKAGLKILGDEDNSEYYFIIGKKLIKSHFP